MPGALQTPEGMQPLPFVMGPELPSMTFATDRSCTQEYLNLRMSKPNCDEWHEPPADLFS